MPGVVHGMRSRFLQDEDGQILEAHSISAGLDYPGVGPEHAFLGELGRAEYRSADDDEVLAAFQLLAETEGIIPALEPAHALAWVVREAGRSIPKDSTVLDHDVRPWRQGRRPGRELAVSGCSSMTGRDARAEPAPAGATPGRKLLVPYITGGLGADWVDVVRPWPPPAPMPSRSGCPSATR